MSEDNQMVEAIVAFGANKQYDNVPIQDRLQRVLAKFPQASLHIIQVSRWYKTPAYPADSGEDFLNGVVKVETTLTPDQIMSALISLESQNGRQRRTRWEARSLDLDLLALGDRVLPDETEYRRWRDMPPADQKSRTPEHLILPHPRIQDRNFVLYPLRDVAPDWLHPVTGQSVDALIAALPPERHAEIRVVE